MNEQLTEVWGADFDLREEISNMRLCQRNFKKSEYNNRRNRRRLCEIKMIFRRLNVQKECTERMMVKPLNFVWQVHWAIGTWKEIDLKITKKSFGTTGKTSSDADMIY